MRICIFGNTGFVGNELLKRLESDLQLILPSRKIDKKLIKENKIFIPFNPEDNIKDYKPDVVINLIGILKENSQATYEETHFYNTQKIVSNSIKYKVKKLIHLSAFGVFKGCNSRYFKTKEQAEEIIKSSPIDYLIIRPAVILGKGQLLLKELTKISPFTPLIFAPSGKTAVVDVSKVVDEIINGINGKSGVCELKDKVITYKEMFEIMLSSAGIRRKIIAVPNFLFYPLIVTKFFIKSPLMTADLYYMMKCSKIYD